jgi:hypothetical protein
VQPSVTAPNRVEPAERHWKACQWLQSQIEVPFAGAAGMQSRSIHSRRHLQLAEWLRLRQQAQCLCQGSAVDRLALKIEPRTVQDQSPDGRDPSGRSPAIQPQRHDQAAGGVGDKDYGQLGMSAGDDRERALKFIVA